MNPGTPGVKPSHAAATNTDRVTENHVLFQPTSSAALNPGRLTSRLGENVIYVQFPHLDKVTPEGTVDLLEMSR